MSWQPPIPGPLDSPLEYAAAFKPVRPGIMTAVGIISIVVGALGILGSLSDGGSAVMYFYMSRIRIPAPAVVAPATMPAGSGAASTQTTQPGLAVVNGGGSPFGNIDRGATILTIVEAALSLMAAVLLIFAGALVMRNSRNALRLHRIYLAVKFPLIVVGAFAKWWFYTGMFNGIYAVAGLNANGAANFGNMMAIFQAGFSAMFSLLYPIALLIVLATKTGKEYGRRIQSNVIPETAG